MDLVSIELPIYDPDAEVITFPCKCNLCGFVIENEEDDVEWHGYGNCVDIPDELWEKWKRESEGWDVIRTHNA